MNKLAIDGGVPTRNTMLPYAHQFIDNDDVQAVINVLKSDWLTTGPKVQEFEDAIKSYTGAKTGSCSQYRNSCFARCGLCSRNRTR